MSDVKLIMERLGVDESIFKSPESEEEKLEKAITALCEDILIRAMAA